jgi:hypothetical protein
MNRSSLWRVIQLLIWLQGVHIVTGLCLPQSTLDRYKLWRHTVVTSPDNLSNLLPGCYFFQTFRHISITTLNSYTSLTAHPSDIQRAFLPPDYDISLSETKRRVEYAITWLVIQFVWGRIDTGLCKLGYFLYSCGTIKGVSSAEVKPCANLFPLCSSAPAGCVQQHANGCNCCTRSAVAFPAVQR